MTPPCVLTSCNATSLQRPAFEDTPMLTMLGNPRRCCDGLTRRETLRAGALSAMAGFGLPQMLQAEDAGIVKNAKAKNVIFIFLLGGAATQDMYDLKPNAPAEVRGEFKPIPTTVRALRFANICQAGSVGSSICVHPIRQSQSRMSQLSAMLHWLRRHSAGSASTTHGCAKHGFGTSVSSRVKV